MTPLRPLWIIDPSVSCPETQGVQQILAGWPGPSRLFQPVLVPGDGPDPRSGYDTAGVVLMGSAVSVHERLPWLQALAEWLRPIVEGVRDVPLLGICFGHQLLAHLAGAQVDFLDERKTKRLGVETTRLNRSRLLPDADELRVVVSHREIVRNVPKGFCGVATREGVVVDGLEHDSRPLYSFQFHPEARDEFARRTGMAEEQIDDRLRVDSDGLLDAFRQLVLRREGA